MLGALSYTPTQHSMDKCKADLQIVAKKTDQDSLQPNAVQ